MSRIKIAVLGAGMVGRTIALDLAQSHSVTSFDISQDNLALLRSLNPEIKTAKRDLLNFAAYPSFLKSFQLVINAVPGFMGFSSLAAIIQAKKNCVDISFFPDNPLTLHELAVKKGVSVITDCGVAPGISNLILGRMDQEYKIDAFTCYVGGIPQNPQPPFYYKAPFSPVDVVQEYLRPCIVREKGKVLTKEPLTERELITFSALPEPLEAFITDGLRTLIHTMKHIPELKEKTLRYKGHIELMLALKHSGLFSEKPVLFKGRKISPLEFTTKLLADQWKLGPEEEEMTVLRVIIREGHREHTWDLVDYYDKGTQLSSMSRTTGYTCTAAAELILHKKFMTPGIFPPERIGANAGHFDFITDYLSKRGVKWSYGVKPISASAK